MNIVDDYNYGQHSSEALASITCAASLAYHGLLGSVDYISLSDMDLTSVPTKHLNSLISSVTGTVYIASVRGCDLISVFESIKSQKLLIFKQRIGREETQAHIPRSKIVV